MIFGSPWRLGAALGTGLAAAAGLAAEVEWAVRPEMRLPPLPEAAAPVIRTVARFDFENGLDGWRSRHPDVVVTQAAAEGVTGRGVLRVRGREPSNWNFAVSPDIPVEPGKTCRASLWARLESQPEGSRPVFFKIEFVSDDPKAGGRVSSACFPPAPAREWRRLEAEFQAPPGCRRVWAALEKGTDSPAAIDVSLDEFALEEIPELSLEAGLKMGALAGPITGALASVHPRIYLTAASLASLRARVRTDPALARPRQTLFQIADQGRRAGPPDYEREVEKAAKSAKPGAGEQLWQRPVGNMIPHLALAFLLSDDTNYLAAARQWIAASLSYPTWGAGEADGLDLAAGHQLAGLGLAYDWLYNHLAEDERAAIRQGVQKRAGAMARAALLRRVWWEHAYLQNHLWVNAAGLATAGFAMVGEVDEAPGWIRLAHEKFLGSLSLLGDDGASHEGVGYWEYGAEYMLRYLELARDLLGLDLYRSGGAKHPWLARSPLYARYLSLPDAAWTRGLSIVDLGDCPRRHWYGPSYILRNLARRYPDLSVAGHAQELAAQVEAAGVDATGSGHYLNLVWFDPAIPRTPLQALPTLRHFQDLGLVSARSDWTGTGSLLVVTCGPPLGHRNLRAAADLGAGHVHPHAGHFVFFAAGRFLLRDDGYSHLKLTGNHSALLVDGKGQKGEGKTWFDYSPWLLDPRAPRILSVSTSAAADVIVCDPAPAYPPDSGLTRWVRTFRFHKPHRLEVLDELEADRPVTFEVRFQAEGTLEPIAAGEYRLTQKGVTARVRIDEAAQAETAIRKGDSGTCLALTSKVPQEKARFAVTITVADALAGGGRSLPP